MLFDTIKANMLLGDISELQEQACDIRHRINDARNELILLAPDDLINMSVHELTSVKLIVSELIRRSARKGVR